MEPFDDAADGIASVGAHLDSMDGGGKQASGTAAEGTIGAAANPIAPRCAPTIHHTPGELLPHSKLDAIATVLFGLIQRFIRGLAEAGSI